MIHTHKTTHLNEVQRVAILKSAISQEQAIKALFNEPNDGYTPSEVHYILTRQRIINAKTPLTSIRRAINTLTKENVLEKTTTLVEGDFGVDEHVWHRKETVKQSELF